MALMDEFKEEREAIKNGTFKQKMAYFWDYYKWYVIVPALVLVFLGYTIIQMVTSPDIVVNGILLNNSNMETQASITEVVDGFAKEQEIDLNKYSIQLSTTLSYVPGDANAIGNMDCLQAIMTWVAAGTVDFINGDITAMTDLAYKGHLEDLREVLTKEQIAKYEPYFLYIDQAVITRQQEAFENKEQNVVITIPDCTKPELMEEPVPVLIDVSSSSKLAKIYGTTTTQSVLGIAVNVPHIETTLEFIEYLLAE